MPRPSPRILLPCRRLPHPIFRPQNLRPLDVALLTLLRAAAEQDDQRLAILREIDPIAWPPADPIFADGTDPFHPRRIAEFEPQSCRRDFCSGRRVKTIEPGPLARISHTLAGAGLVLAARPRPLGGFRTLFTLIERIHAAARKPVGTTMPNTARHSPGPSSRNSMRNA